MPAPDDDPRQRLVKRYRATREATEALAAPLSAEDQMLQAMPDASPTKWHRAHTTWFFETFILGPRGVAPADARYGYLFNSYYDAVGPRHARPKRGLLSRPTCDEVAAYRRAVDESVLRLLERLSDAELAEAEPILSLGIAHEEQHQELILTDILAAFSESSLGPIYQPAPTATTREPPPLSFIGLDGGLVEVGAPPMAGFAFDNEGPRHRVFLEPFELATRPVLVADVLAFAGAGGYRTPSLWLSEGWEWVQREGASAPGYAVIRDGALQVFSLHGARCADPAAPAGHLSYYEADAITRWLGGRLPTEQEWELAASSQPMAGHFREDGVLVPQPSPSGRAISALYGDVWEWTRSAYSPYPGYAAGPGALGEYNGKFMVGQIVLRGGSCLSNREHLRASYRNFWPARTRFQMTGARVARDPRRGPA